MGCCGGGSPQRVRKQVVEPVVVEAEVPKRVVRSQAAKPASISRQYVVPRKQCAKCGYPTMVVHIAGRERYQCSNANCRIVAI
jgi:hypothetical protein